MHKEEIDNMKMKLQENLKRLIEEQRIQVSQLAATLEIANSTLHGWLNGVPPRNIIELKKLSTYFGMSLDDLCFGPLQLIQHTEKVVFALDNVELILKIKIKETV